MTALALLLPLVPAWTQSPGIADELRGLVSSKAAPGVIAARIRKALDGDELKSGADFLAASQAAPFGSRRLPETRVRYELCLTALCLGEKSALPQLATTWDDLLDSVSRSRRHRAVPNSRTPKTVLTERVIRDVWGGKSTHMAAPNPRIKTIFDEDQAVRHGDLTKFTKEDIEKMARGDAARLKEARSIVRQGSVGTSEDFARLAFLFQHASSFEDYATAHELAVCAVVLGRRSSSWIAGASYDRMMLSASYPQRFGTQFRIFEGNYEFDTIDTTMTNDAERMAVIRLTLAEAKKIFDK